MPVFQSCHTRIAMWCPRGSNHPVAPALDTALPFAATSHFVGCLEVAQNVSRGFAATIVPPSCQMRPNSVPSSRLRLAG